MEAKNRIKQFIEEIEMEIIPKSDYMIIDRQEEKKHSLILPKDAETIRGDLIPFKIVSIGPGRWEHGTFIATNHKPGQIVFILGGVMETKFRGKPYTFAREKDVVCQLT